MKPTIAVIGSSNTDMVLKTKQLPAPGETILGGTCFMNAGGKGTNQAVAVARLKGAVTFITKTGTDLLGRPSKYFACKIISLQKVRTVEYPVHVP
jgi:ribokinase